MGLDNLKKADGSTRKIKRVGRGQGSGMGKTATRGGKGQTARTGSSQKRGFEGGQTPMHRRLPKVGFNSRVIKPFEINVDKNTKISFLETITMETLKSVASFGKSVEKVKLIGEGAKTLASKINDLNVTCSG